MTGGLPTSAAPDDSLARIAEALERLAALMERAEKRDAARAMADATLPAAKLRAVR